MKQVALDWKHKPGAAGPLLPLWFCAYLPAGSCGAVIPSLAMADNRNQQKYILGGKNPWAPKRGHTS